jgi:tRNA modification GTPase
MSVVDRKFLRFEDTIYARASGSLPCAVAIFRLSGGAVFDFARKYFRGSQRESLEKRGMYYGALVDASSNEIDSVLLLSFVAPHSFTGQNVIEIQCHGSIAIAEKLESLFLSEGFRPATPGEFSYRAFHFGKLDSDSLEKLGDVFLARSAHDLERVYRRKDHSIENDIHKVREELVRLQAVLDTAVDFSDEYATVTHLAKGPLSRAKELCEGIASRYEAFRLGVQRPRLVLAGRPNAGKSSLFNALLCRYRAIVHSSAGTTRDAIEEDIEFGGRPWKLVDTAGVRSGLSEAERQGIELGAEFLESASYWVLVVDGTLGMSEAEQGLLDQFATIPHTIVWNKSDHADYHPPPGGLSGLVLEVSALNSEAIKRLNDHLSGKAQPLPEASLALPTSVQAKRLRSAMANLSVLERELDESVPPEVLGERNRMVLQQVNSVIGDVGVEDVLDRVFSEFCIGK